MNSRLLPFLLATSSQIAFCEEMKPNAEPDKEPLGVVATARIDGQRVVYRFVTQGPTEKQRKQLPWRAVVSWKYDGAENEGMPSKAILERMVKLEEALEKGVVKAGSCEHLISSTGNNLKELIYYIHDRDTFLDQLNDALEDHEAYPIEIVFFSDPEWTELMELRADFKTDDAGDGAKDPAKAQAQPDDAKKAPDPEPQKK